MTLKELKIGESAVIDTVGGTGELRQHFLDMGLIPGEKVTLVKFAPMGDPMELQIHGKARSYVIWYGYPPDNGVFLQERMQTFL